jgi:lipopolysaccharide biosynthesis glycosyltransferase
MLTDVFIGYDPREDEAYKVCKHSMVRNTVDPSIEIHTLQLDSLIDQGIYKRKFTISETGQKIDVLDGKPFSTDFSFSRFLVPSLMNFKGWALFVDCDFLFLNSLKELDKYLDDKYAVICVHHNYNPSETIKMDGVKQERYFRKNWSSFVLWNSAHPANKVLTPELVNTSTGSYLHRFGWLEDNQIGQVPEEWNWLEGHSSKEIKPKAIHYTRGGPWFDNYKNVDYADLWLNELAMIKNEVTK